MVTSLVAQWLRVHLPMQGTRVQALVWEDPTCCRATKPVHHNHWATTTELLCRNYWAHVLQLLNPFPQSSCSPTREAIAMRSPLTTRKSSPCWPQLGRKPMHSNEDPMQPHTHTQKNRNKQTKTPVAMQARQIGMLGQSPRCAPLLRAVGGGHRASPQSTLENSSLSDN